MSIFCPFDIGHGILPSEGGISHPSDASTRAHALERIATEGFGFNMEPNATLSAGL